MNGLLKGGLLALALALGVPGTSTHTTRNSTTVTHSIECIVSKEETMHIHMDGIHDPGADTALTLAPEDQIQDIHWVREYMGYEYRGLERVIHEVDLAGIDLDELQEFQRMFQSGRTAHQRRLMTSLLLVHGSRPSDSFARQAADYIGFHPFANDAYLLHAIEEDQELRVLFFNRVQLLRDTREMLPDIRVPRRDNGGRLYTETPNLDTLDSLNLLRLNLYLKAVNEPLVQDRIRDIVSADLANTRTEFGGMTFLDGGHYVRFQPVNGKEYSNGSYAGQYYRPLIGSLGTFHLHATGSGNDHRYSGPSVPDLRAARITNTTGFVITLLEQSDRHYRLGMDFYYVDPRTYNDRPISASNPIELSPRTVRVVDIGMFSVRNR